ncbi:16S rRNA (guanine966-N2)-methyltransferase [Hasllibacter halocynthiae]|uniref:16S rRNA (Guanine966-N2)-methyltransferase n=1 Tax=Hasllibacter halocynthiae TaxID=595589 RepID=A0A2T0X1W2_9RHOB|nr:RsmD family RNA methyltransferase [Hasllibacter halocynthiae]PRY92939.1 16S rRNA (guanine966-N2)-methyltransferase [Hasllibacter halocynthiae]
MRITGGTARGRALAPLGRGDEAARLRPTPDRVREALFSILASRGAVEGARVLDLFAGTGALGLEALSRGAAAAVLVDDGRAAARLIAANVERTGLPARHLRRDATRLPPNPDAPFGLILLDPPYGRGLGERALAAARRGGWVAPGALALWEEGAPMAPPAGFRPLDARRYGATFLTLLEAEEGA